MIDKEYCGNNCDSFNIGCDSFDFEWIFDVSLLEEVCFRCVEESEIQELLCDDGLQSCNSFVIIGVFEDGLLFFVLYFFCDSMFVFDVEGENMVLVVWIVVFNVVVYLVQCFFCFFFFVNGGILCWGFGKDEVNDCYEINLILLSVNGCFEIIWVLFVYGI